MPEVIVIPPNEERKKRLRVAAYCRVSTENDLQAASLQSQVRHYESEIRNNPDWDFVGVYYDTKSGLRVENRKSFGVDVWIEMNGMKLSTSRDSDFAIMLTVAQSESEAKSGNIKFGIEHGFKTGKSKIYDRICYGYS